MKSVLECLCRVCMFLILSSKALLLSCTFNPCSYPLYFSCRSNFSRISEGIFQAYCPAYASLRRLPGVRFHNMAAIVICLRLALFDVRPNLKIRMLPASYLSDEAFQRFSEPIELVVRLDLVEFPLKTAAIARSSKWAFSPVEETTDAGCAFEDVFS